MHTYSKCMQGLMSRVYETILLLSMLGVMATVLAGLLSSIFSRENTEVHCTHTCTCTCMYMYAPCHKHDQFTRLPSELMTYLILARPLELERCIQTNWDVTVQDYVKIHVGLSAIIQVALSPAFSYGNNPD